MGIQTSLKASGKVMPPTLPVRVPLFFSDFEHGADEREFVDEAGSWAVQPGGFIKETTAGSHCVARTLYGSGLQDYQVESYGRIVAADTGIKIIARFQDTDNYYALWCSDYDDTMRFDKWVGGDETITSWDVPDVPVDSWFYMRIKVQGTTIELEFDGNVHTVTDTDLAYGYPALGSHANEGEHREMVVRRV